MKRVTPKFVAACACVAALGARPGDAGAAPAGSQPDYDPDRWAILIGVTNYTDPSFAGLSRLRGPGNDARHLRDALVARGRFDPKHVVVVAEGAEYPPTRDQIIEQLAAVTRNVQGGLLLFFFAGHGLAYGDDAYLLPSSATHVDQPTSTLFQESAIKVSTVKKAIEEAKPQQVILMIDACRNNPASPRSRSVELIRDSDAFRRAFLWSNSVTIFATQPGQEAYESGGATSGGYFADAVADALVGKARKAIDPDGQVTIASLMGYLPDEVDWRVKQVLPDLGQRPEFLLDMGRTIVLSYLGGVPLPEPLPTHPPPRARTPTDVDVHADITTSPGRGRMAGAITAGAVGVGAVVAGLVFWSRAAALSAQVSSKCAVGCDPTDWEGPNRDGPRDARLAAILLVSGGVVAAAGAAAALYFHGRAARVAPPPAGALDLALQPGGAKLSFVRRW